MRVQHLHILCVFLYIERIFISGENLMWFWKHWTLLKYFMIKWRWFLLSIFKKIYLKIFLIEHPLHAQYYAWCYVMFKIILNPILKKVANILKQKYYYSFLEDCPIHTHMFISYHPRVLFEFHVQVQSSLLPIINCHQFSSTIFFSVAFSVSILGTGVAKMDATWSLPLSGSKLAGMRKKTHFFPTC